MRGGKGGKGVAERRVLGWSPFNLALEQAHAQVEASIRVQIPTSCRRRYSRRGSPRPIEHEQQLPSESKRLPASCRGLQGLYSRRHSQRQIKHGQQLPSESTRLPASCRGFTREGVDRLRGKQYFIALTSDLCGSESVGQAGPNTG